MSDEHQLTEPERVSPSDMTIPDSQVPPVWPPAQQNFRRRSTFPVWATILLIVLAFALIIGGLGLIFYTTTLQYRASVHNQATAIALSTAHTLETAQAQAQATANTLATANANIYASATAQAGATVTATAIATALGNILTQATSGTSALDDPLSDNSGNHNWDKTQSSVDGQCVFTSSGYKAQAARQGYFQPCFAEATSFSNFAYQVSMIIDQGKQAGIVFRGNSASNAFYLFYIGINGSYSLDIYKGSSHATTLNNGFSSSITTGLKQTNQLAVVAYKNILYLYVNQQFITSVTDSTLNSGKIGVAALDSKNPTAAAFTNARVWNITSSNVLTPTASNTPTPTPTATNTATVTPTSSSTP